MTEKAKDLLDQYAALQQQLRAAGCTLVSVVYPQGEREATVSICFADSLGNRRGFMTAAYGAISQAFATMEADPVSPYLATPDLS